MRRTAQQMAEVLTALHSEQFKNESDEGFQLTWPDFRALAGGRRLDKKFISEINDYLVSDNFVAAPFDRFIAVVSGADLCGLRKASGRIIEQFMPEQDEDIEIDDDDDDEIRCADDVDYSDD